MANCNPRGGILPKVYAKIETEYGLDKEFTHWDFEEFLGKDKSKDRNRIAVRLVFLHKRGILKKVGSRCAKRTGKNYGVYQARIFPISASSASQVEEQGLNSSPKIDLDSLFFNLGRKPQDRVNLRGRQP
jgi:hypothetical protein